MSETPHSVPVDAHNDHAGESVHLPKATSWPFLLALGLTLVFAALVMDPLVGVLAGDTLREIGRAHV